MRQRTENVTPLHRVRTYEELDGGQGREVFFRPHRYRASDLAPLRCEVEALGRTCALLDVSQNGVAMEWPREAPIAVGDRLEQVTVRFDDHVAYRGEARVGSVREGIVGLSFGGLQLAVDEILHLKAIKGFAQHRQQPLWQAEGQERFKVLISELRLWLEDAEAELDKLEKELPWHVVHGEPSPAQGALVDQLRRTLVADLVATTESIDAAVRSAPPAHTKALTEYSRRQLHSFFMQSPSMHRAANKPFGYPGDYEVMRFIYERPFEGTTLFGKTISLAFDATRAARAVRHRKDLVKRTIRELVETRRRPLRLLAVASGPAQELCELLTEMPEMPAPLEIVLFDQDKGALSYAYRRLRPSSSVKLVYLHDSIKRLLRDADIFAEFGSFDLIYTVGLFDYLRQSTAVQLARNLYARVAPGGAAMIANMVPENPSRWYMEHHLDWHLIYRSRPELLEIGKRAAPGARQQILEEESGVNPFLELARD